MTTTFFKKYWLILISCCGLGGVAFACSFDDTPEYGTSNFTPEAFVDKGYSPFFYSDLEYYGIGFDEAQNSRFEEEDARAWRDYLSPRIDIRVIRFLLDSAGQEGIDSLAGHVGRSGRAAAFFTYLRLAKLCESFAVAPDRWSTEKKERYAVDTIRLHHDLRNGMAAAKDVFLKERYWFQWIRSCFFNGAPGEAISVYKAYSPLFPSDVMHFRCMAYMAGAYNKLHDIGHANYYYSLVFDSCADLRTTAHWSFRPSDESDWKASLALCTTIRQKTTLWQMLGIFYQDPQRAIREIYALDPGSDKLEVLLSRAINISEQRFSPPNTDYFYGTRVPDSSDRALSQLVGHIAEARNTSKPWAWQLAAGYLATLDHRYSAADAWFEKARKELPPDTLAREQYQLLAMINRVAGNKGVNARLEQSLIPDLNLLLGQPEGTNFRFTTALDWLRTTMSKRYAAAGDKVKAECFLSTPAFYADNGNVEALKAFLTKQTKSPYEALCGRLCARKVEDLLEYQAVRLGLADNVDEAIAHLKQTGNGNWEKFPGNPFNARINDCHDCDHEAPQKIKYDAMSFLQKLQELKAKIAAGQEVYTNAILMGNAHYNITQFGNARVFFECNVIGVADSEPSLIDSVFRGTLLSMAMTEHYYNLALAAAKTDEQKARCQYLLAKCQRNDWYAGHIFSDPGYDYSDSHAGKDFVAWDGFKALRQYPQTQYYKEVLRECGYFKTYIAENPGR